MDELNLGEKQFKNNSKSIEKDEKNKLKEENSYPSKNYILKSSFQIKNTQENSLK